MDLLINNHIGVQATHPISKTPNWHTDVVVYDSGKEQRNQVRETPTRTWGIAWSVLNATQRAKLLEIYNRAKGKYDTFQFRDPDEEDGNFSAIGVGYEVSASNATAKTFTITGEHPEAFTDGVKFEIVNGSDDGDWECDGNSISDGTNTIVTVTGTPSGDSGVGNSHDIISSDNGTSLFKIGTTDITADFLDGVVFTVDSGVNAGEWTCDGNSTWDATNTVVVVTVAPIDTPVIYDIPFANTERFVTLVDYTASFLDGVEFTIADGINAGSWVCNGDSTWTGTETWIEVVGDTAWTATATTATITGGEGALAVLSDAVILIQDYQLTHTSYDGTDEEYTEIKNEIQHFDITAVSVANDTFTVFGGHTGEFGAGTKFIVTDSTGNDENWVVESSIRAGENTVVTVVGNITDANADGTIVLMNVISNAVEQTPGVDYEIDENTGIIQFLADKAPADAYVVSATFKYAFRVRFNSDAQAMTEFSNGNYEYMDVELIEVKP